MRKFFAGVFVGWACSDFITRGLKEAVKFADENVVKKPVDVAQEPTTATTEVDFDRASYENPADGADLPLERIVQINASTPEEPVEVTYDELSKMSRRHAMVALGNGRLKFTEKTS